MKTLFTKEQLRKSGMYLLHGPKQDFVARFKYKGPITMSVFKKELIRSHTVEDYFEKRNQGMAPLDILKQKNPSWYQEIKEAWLSKHWVS